MGIVDPTLIRRLRSELYGAQSGVKFRRFLLAFRFNPDQPRDDRGRWTETDGATEDEPPATVEGITARGKEMNLAARSDRDRYKECLDLCYPLLERFQPPGSDQNTWDFHKCMNLCLGKR